MKGRIRPIFDSLTNYSFSFGKGVVPLGYIAKFLPKKPVIVEAGAHIGVDTLAMARRWPRGMIHAFEPVPALFDMLVRNTSGLANVKCYSIALGRATRTANIHVSGGSSDGSSSLLEPNEHLCVHPNVTFDETRAVEVISLDEWAHANNICHVDLMWFDLQGMELEVLRGAQALLATVRAIYSEVHFIESYKGCPLYADLRDWLESNGFRVDREELAWTDAGNVFFVQR